MPGTFRRFEQEGSIFSFSLPGVASWTGCQQGGLDF
jgi:hypothetical protein